MPAAPYGRLAAVLAAFPPVLVLAVLLILLGTQLAYVVAPRAPHYLVRLGLSALAVLGGELLGAAGLGEGLAVGQLHPVTDLVLLTIAQLAAGRWASREQAV